MKNTRHILQTILLAAALLEAGQSAWAQSNVGTFPVEVTFQGMIYDGKYQYAIICSNLGKSYDSMEQNLQNNWNYVRFDEKSFDIGNNDVPLTMTLRGNFSFGASMGDATVHGQNASLTFTSEKKYILGVEVSTKSGTPVSVFSITGDSFSRKVLMIENTTFGKVTLTMATHTPLNAAATISGIEDTYLDDGVNHPVPTVTYKEFDNSTPITLTEGVDYTVSYNVGNTDGTVTVTGIGQYTGSKSQSYNIRQLQLSDFHQLGDGSYEIATKQDLDNLAKYVNNGNNCSNVTFRQTADIAYTHTTTWYDFNSSDEENNYTPIGGYGMSFQGTYDGGGYTVMGIRVYINRFDQHQNESLGLFGYISGGTVKNIILRDAKIEGSKNIGGIVGYLSNSTVSDCQIYQVLPASIASGNAEDNGVGIIAGYISNSTITGTHFRECRIGYTFKDGASARLYCNDRCDDLFALTLGTYISASKTSGESVTIDNVTYYTEGSTFTLGYSGEVPEGYQVIYSASAGTISGNTLTMPDTDVTVTAFVRPIITILTGHLSDGFYWATYYDHDVRFTLPEGAQAFTMGTDYKLYRLGDDGRVIPAGEAVVIISDVADIELISTSDGSNIIVHGPENKNILHGSDSAVVLTEGKVTVDNAQKTPYVLGVSSNTFGFHQYTGTAIPANKAYYVQ